MVRGGRIYSFNINNIFCDYISVHSFTILIKKAAFTFKVKLSAKLNCANKEYDNIVKSVVGL